MQNRTSDGGRRVHAIACNRVHPIAAYAAGVAHTRALKRACARLPCLMVCLPVIPAWASASWLPGTENSATGFPPRATCTMHRRAEPSSRCQEELGPLEGRTPRAGLGICLRAAGLLTRPSDPPCIPCERAPLSRIAANCDVCCRIIRDCCWRCFLAACSCAGVRRLLNKSTYSSSNSSIAASWAGVPVMTSPPQLEQRGTGSRRCRICLPSSEPRTALRQF